MEFKGTKGKWVSNGNDVLIDDRSRQIQLEYNCGGFGIEREYNALLISKAPEMLEMLKEIIYSDSDVEDVYRRAKQLIKQATEL